MDPVVKNNPNMPHPFSYLEKSKMRIQRRRRQEEEAKKIEEDLAKMKIEREKKEDVKKERSKIKETFEKPLRPTPETNTNKDFQAFQEDKIIPSTPPKIQIQAPSNPTTSTHQRVNVAKPPSNPPESKHNISFHKSKDLKLNKSLNRSLLPFQTVPTNKFLPNLSKSKKSVKIFKGKGYAIQSPKIKTRINMEEYFNELSKRNREKSTNDDDDDLNISNVSFVHESNDEQRKRFVPKQLYIFKPKKRETNLSFLKSPHQNGVKVQNDRQKSIRAQLQKSFLSPVGSMQSPQMYQVRRKVKVESKKPLVHSNVAKEVVRVNNHNQNISIKMVNQLRKEKNVNISKSSVKSIKNVTKLPKIVLRKIAPIVPKVIVKKDDESELKKIKKHVKKEEGFKVLQKGERDKVKKNIKGIRRKSTKTKRKKRLESLTKYSKRFKKMVERTESRFKDANFQLEKMLSSNELQNTNKFEKILNSYVKKFSERFQMLQKMSKQSLQKMTDLDNKLLTQKFEAMGRKMKFLEEQAHVKYRSAMEKLNLDNTFQDLFGKNNVKSDVERIRKEKRINEEMLKKYTFPKWTESSPLDHVDFYKEEESLYYEKVIGKELNLKSIKNNLNTINAKRRERQEMFEVNGGNEDNDFDCFRMEKELEYPKTSNINLFTQMKVKEDKNIEARIASVNLNIVRNYSLVEIQEKYPDLSKKVLQHSFQSVVDDENERKKKLILKNRLARIIRTKTKLNESLQEVKMKKEREETIELDSKDLIPQDVSIKEENFQEIEIEEEKENEVEKEDISVQTTELTVPKIKVKEKPVEMENIIERVEGIETDVFLSFQNKIEDNIMNNLQAIEKDIEENPSRDDDDDVIISKNYVNKIGKPKSGFYYHNKNESKEIPSKPVEEEEVYGDGGVNVINSKKEVNLVLTSEADHYINASIATLTDEVLGRFLDKELREKYGTSQRDMLKNSEIPLTSNANVIRYKQIEGFLFSPEFIQFCISNGIKFDGSEVHSVLENLIGEFIKEVIGKKEKVNSEREAREIDLDEENEKRRLDKLRKEKNDLVLLSTLLMAENGMSEKDLDERNQKKVVEREDEVFIPPKKKEKKKENLKKLVIEDGNTYLLLNDMDSVQTIKIDNSPKETPEDREKRSRLMIEKILKEREEKLNTKKLQEKKVIEKRSFEVQTENTPRNTFSTQTNEKVIINRETQMEVPVRLETPVQTSKLSVQHTEIQTTQVDVRNVRENVTMETQTYPEDFKGEEIIEELDESGIFARLSDSEMERRLNEALSRKSINTTSGDISSDDIFKDVSISQFPLIAKEAFEREISPNELNESEEDVQNDKKKDMIVIESNERYQHNNSDNIDRSNVQEDPNMSNLSDASVLSDESQNSLVIVGVEDLQSSENDITPLKDNTGGESSSPNVNSPIKKKIDNKTTVMKPLAFTESEGSDVDEMNRSLERRKRERMDVMINDKMIVSDDSDEFEIDKMKIPLIRITNNEIKELFTDSDDVDDKSELLDKLLKSSLAVCKSNDIHS